MGDHALPIGVRAPTVGRSAGLLAMLRARARRGLLIEGALPHPEAAHFVAQLRRGVLLPVPLDAERPDDADVLVVVGRIPARLAEPLAWASQRLVAPATVVVFEDPKAPPTYATQSAQEIVAIDILVRELPPRGETLAALRPLLGRRLPT